MQTLRRWGRNLGTYAVVVIVGTLGGTLFWLFYALGLVRVKGYWRLVKEVYRGNHLIATNHPTLIETVLIPLMFWPIALIMPRRFFIWSMAGDQLFEKWPFINYVIFTFCHCVPISRSGRSNKSSVQVSHRALTSGGTVSIHPEQGRSGSEFRGDVKPHKHWGVDKKSGRKIRRIISKATGIAISTGARITPMWADITFWETNNSWSGFWVWIKGWHRITFYVGEAYTPDPDANLHMRNKELGKRILTAGLS